MRINAGKFRNHNIEMTNLETTRETSDKVRQAIFNLIGQFFDGGVALDLFAGSGAMGFEAYSRGISKVYLNDINQKALDICRANARKLKCEEDITFINKDFKDALEGLKGIKFDLIMLDPPYKMDDVDSMLRIISDLDLLNEDGYITFEMNKDTKCSDIVGKYHIEKDRTYGIKRVVIYRGE